MSPVRVLVLAAAITAVAAPLASIAAPADSGACAARPMTLTERRIRDEAAKGCRR